MKTMKRLLAVLLVLALTLSNLPVAALASELAEPEVQETVVQETAAPSEEAAEEPAPSEEAAEEPAPEEEAAEAPEETEDSEETLEVTVEEAESAGVPASDDGLYSPAFTFHSGFPVGASNKITEFEADPDEENVFYLRYYPAPWVDSSQADTVPGTFVSRYPDHCTWELVYESQYESVYKITLNELGNQRVADMGIGESWEYIVWHDGIVYWMQNGIQMQKQFNAAGHLYITNKDATNTAVTPPIILPEDNPYPPYLTCHWLGNDGQGWYQQEGGDFDGFRVMPGQEVQLVFFLNYWHEGRYVKMPTHVKPVSGDLKLELIGSENAAPGEQATEYFYRITTGTWDQHIDLVAANDESVGGVMAHTDRNEVCIYSSPIMSNETCVTGPYVYDLELSNANELYVGFSNDYWSNVTFTMEYNWMMIQDTENPNVKRLYVNGDTERLLAQGYEDYFAIKATATGRNGETGVFYANFSMIADPDSIPHDPYLSYGWVGRWEEGLTLAQAPTSNYMGAFMPGMENSLCFVLNTWDEDAGRFVQTPVIPQNDHGLILEPVPADQIAPNQEFAAGFVYLINPGIWDTEVPLYVTLEDGTRAEGVTVNTNRGEMCAYSSTELSNETVIMEFVADYTRDDNHFYIALTNDWLTPAGELFVAHEQYASFFDIQKVTDTVYKVTLTREYLEQIRAQGGEDVYGGFEIQVQNQEGSTWTTGLSYGLWLRLDPATVPHEPYLTYGWLDNWGEGFFDSGEWHENEGFNICPGDEFNIIFFLNLWDEEKQCFVAHPVPVSDLRCSGVNFAQTQHIQEGQENANCFACVTAKESALGDTLELYVLHQGERIGWPITVDLHRMDYYTSQDISYKNRLMGPLEIDPEGETSVYLGINDHADMIATNVYLTEDCQGMANIQKLSDTVWKITATEQAIEKTLVQYMAGINIHVDFRHKDNPDWTEWEEQWFDLSRMELQTQAAMDINFDSYEFLEGGYIVHHYPTGEFDEWGNEIWDGEVTQLPQGLSYDFDTNTLTLENYHGEAFGVWYRNYNHETGEEWFNLPTDTLTVNLIGENSLISDRGTAAEFGGGMNVVFTGDGSLHIKSTNSVDQKDREGNALSYPALWIDGGSLTFQDNVNVTMEIAGQAMQGRWDENGYLGDAPALLIALDTYQADITLKDNATLTTLVPQGGRSNGPTLPEDHQQVFWNDRNPGGYRGINGFQSLTVSGGTLNTSDLHINRTWHDDNTWTGGSFVMTGGTVNIEALGTNLVAERWEWNEETQQNEFKGTYDALNYDGIYVDTAGKVNISGGTLNIEVAPEMSYEEMPATFTGMHFSGAELTVSGGEINLIPGYDGVMLCMETLGWGQNGTHLPSSFTMTGGKLKLDGVDDCRVTGVDVYPESTFTFTGGTIEASQADFRMGGDVTIDGGTLRGVNLDYYSDNTFKFNSGLISLQEESSIMMGMGEMNGGTMDLDRTGVVVLGGFQFNGGQIRIVNKGEDIFWPGLIVETYMAMNNDAKLVLEHSALAPAMEVRGTFHQMDNSTVTIDHYSYAGEAAVFVPVDPEGEEHGTLLLNDGKFYINGLNGQHIQGLRMDQTSVAEFGEGDVKLTNADVEFNGTVVMHDNTFNMQGGTVYMETPGELTLNNADFSLITKLEERPDPEEWYIAFLASVGTKVTVNGGNFYVDAKGYDCAVDLCGDYTQTAGKITVDSDSMAMAVKGIGDISGGELNLSGMSGYEQDYIPEISENSRLILSGGVMNIDAVQIGMSLYGPGEISGGNVNITVEGLVLDAPELNGQVLVGQGILVCSNEYTKSKLTVTGGDVNVEAPTDTKGYVDFHVNGFFILDSDVELLGGTVHLKAVNAYYAECAEDCEMLVLGENMIAVSQNTGNQLKPLKGILYLNDANEIVAPEDATWVSYCSGFEEDNEMSFGDLNEEIARVSDVLISEGSGDRITRLEADVEELLPGQTATLTAESTNPNAELEWTLADGDKSYVTLKVGKDNTATVTAKKNKQLREVTVTVSLKGSSVSRELKLTVLPVVSKVHILDLAGSDLTGQTMTYYMGTENNILPLTAANEPEEAVQAVTWKSSNEKFATVDENGLVTVLVPGKSVTITATATDGSNRKATLKLKTVLPIHEIRLPGSAVCAVGKTVNLKPELLPANATDSKVIWEIVEGREYASVSNGKLKGIAAGEAVVRISAQWNRDIYAECRVRIYPAVKQVDILMDQEIVTKKTLTLLMSTDGHNSLQLYAESMPDGAFQDVTWKSSNNKYVTVDETGKVTALEAGKTVTITATATDGTGRKATVKIKTEQPVEELTITGSDVAAAGKTISLAASIYPANATNKKVRWSIVEGSELASISNSGKLKVNKKIQDGQTVTVRLEWAGNTEDYEITDERTVTLYSVAASGVDIVDTEGVSITKQQVLTMSSFVSNTIELDAVVKSGEAAQEVLWKSSNEKYAVVDADGTVTILMPDKPVTITATAADGSGKKDSVKVKGVQPMEGLSLKEELLDKAGNLFVAGGKSLKLATAVNIQPQLTSNKKLNWTVETNDYGIKINASTGVLSTKKVNEPVTVEVNAEAKDESGVSISFYVTVYPASTKVTIWYQGREMTSKDKLEYGPGSQLVLTAKSMPENAAQQYTWKVSNKKYASVDENGVVTLLDAIGKTVTITATSADGTNKKATLKIKIVEAPPVVLP